jgi:NAD(P)H-dependent FMN reductase
MSEDLRVVAVIGTLQRDSATFTVVQHVTQRLEQTGCIVDIVDLRKEPLAIFDPEAAYTLPNYSRLQDRVNHADVILLATPDYHGSISGALKNFLDHFWREFAGKLFVTVVASPEKGLTVTEQLRTVARQCYAWVLPYGIAFTTDTDVKDGAVVNEPLRERLMMLVRDIGVYGRLLAEQRRADLAATEPGFLARYRV